MRIDLHTHSEVSDGTDTPSALVSAAVAAGLDVVALTDHDTTAGWDEAADAARRHGIALVPGAEISCRAAGTSVHLLSYLHDPHDAGLLAEAERTRAARADRARHIVARIAVDLDLTWEDVEAQMVPGTTVGRPHIADALVARGHVPDRAAAFASVLSTGSPYYVPHHAPDADVAVRLVLEAGGVPVLAHPSARARGHVVPDPVITHLTEVGLVGLEVHHRDHTPADRDRLTALAARHGLLVTGSSDYHGTGKPNRLGENLTAPHVLEQIEDLGSGRVVRP
ncbi:PHP domain-containing protein [Cellulomonas bogoriensis]|uniref:Metal-dependent phosphoesterase n=1 Tax=Cellulomonas bogoriensis 69B4 = DSM 16987 TaxID=1386082 RepID=A0A0A0C201_9CELL|nr:PHP domain-containing protein [Cellulomonas bogoriensis]KGM14017.1 metal-dependent phosphoesterase [Cellulomonas bogoriensis 69B4 = DSM 16987]